MSLWLVMSSVDDESIAHELAREMVAKKLAACVSITLPVTSHYIWNGEQQEAREYLLLIKTLAENYAALEAFLKARHPYEVPEIVSIKSEEVEPNYLNWLCQQTKL